MQAQKKEPSPEARRAKRRREELGWSQERLAEIVRTKQQTINKWETGVTRQSRLALRIYAALGLSAETPANRDNDVIKPTERVLPPLVGSVPTLPVFGGARNRQGGFILTREPVEAVLPPQALLHVKDSYGFVVVDDSMSPEFEIGDVALVHPHRPPVLNAACAFYTAMPGNREVVGILARLHRFDDERWVIHKHNAPRGEKADLSLRRSEWPVCHVVVGRYARW